MKQWVVIGLETSVDWPVEDTKITFRDREIILRPETDDRAPTIAIPYDSDEEYDDVATIGTEFLSTLAWLKGRYIRETLWTGGSGPIFVGKGPMARHVDPRFRLDYLPEPQNEKARLAVSLFREALNINSVAYQFLGYFKIINMLHAGGAGQKGWINRILPRIEDFRARKRIAELRSHLTDVGDYLYSSGRCAVAHAYAQPVVNPDDPADRKRLSADLPVMRALAEYAIEHEFGVKSVTTVHREHLYELDGFRRLLGVEMADRLKAENDVPADLLPPLPNLSIRLRGQPPFPVFESLKSWIVESQNGTLYIDCESHDGFTKTYLVLDFPKERLGFDPFQGVRISDDGSTTPAKYAADVHRYIKELIGNGEIEVWDGQQQRCLGRYDPFMPYNMRPDAAYGELDRMIAFWEKVAISRGEAAPQ